MSTEWLSQERLKLFFESNEVLCLNSQPSILYLKDVAPDSIIGEWMPALQPSKLFAKLASEGVAKIRAKSDGSPVYGVHARLEEDWVRGCSVGLRVERMALQLECYVNESSIASYMTEHGVKAGAAVYVSSGLTREHFPTLCHLFTCLFKGDVVSIPLQLQPLFMKQTIAAYLDTLIIESVDHFFGNRYSTFSAFIQHEMKLRNKPTSFYNKPFTYNLTNAP
jgi:hypothetical protein